MGDAQLVDAMIHDGLWCAFHDVHMGIHGSAVAAEYKVSREAQDEWALRSHERAHKATESGRLAQEIAPLVIPQKKGDPLTVALDESIRPDTTLEKLAKLKPVFDASGTVTAGNAPGINDGAAALLVMSREKADALGLKPLARIVAYGEVAEDYPYLATAPAHAIQVALKKADLTLAQLDRIEINEAFASVALISSQILGADAEKVNVHGGAIAMGHPIGASGARLIGTLVYELMSQGLKYGADFEHMDDLPLMEKGALVDPTSIWTAYDAHSLELNGVYDTDARLCLEANAPRPCTLLGLVMSITTHEKL